LLFGGAARLGPNAILLDDTWEFDGRNWRELEVSGPPGRRGAGSAFDAARREWIIFSGTIETADREDLWRFDAAAGSWSMLAGDGFPGARSLHGFGFAPDEGVFVSFGGLSQPNFSAIGEAWSLSLRP
jgi:hypothetical protein